MKKCPFCTDMSKGYVCVVCGRKDAESEFEFQWYAATVRLVATEPAVLYRHGPRKGEPKSPPVEKVLIDSLTHYYHYDVQGIRNAAACESIVRDSYRTLVKELESQGYTGIRVVVSVAGVYF